jgi:hypothetical protein
MSTIFLGETRFASIATSLAYHVTRDMTPQSRPLLSSRLCGALALSGEWEPESLVPAIYAIVFDWQRLNAAAFERAYQGRHGTRNDIVPVQIGMKGETLSPVALFKALQCLSYNCDDGQDGRNSLALLQTLLADLAEHIVTSLPEYDSAEW